MYAWQARVSRFAGGFILKNISLLCAKVNKDIGPRCPVPLLFMISRQIVCDVPGMVGGDAQLGPAFLAPVPGAHSSPVHAVFREKVLALMQGHGLCSCRGALCSHGRATGLSVFLP